MRVTVSHRHACLTRWSGSVGHALQSGVTVGAGHVHMKRVTGYSKHAHFMRVSVKVGPQNQEANIGSLPFSESATTCRPFPYSAMYP